MSPSEDEFKSEEPEVHSDPSQWAYPDGFDAALSELYERSFLECDLPPEVQFEVLEAFQNSGADAADILSPDFGPSIHTIEMWAARRLDLTAESLVLSDDWRARFPPSPVEQVEARFAALAFVSRAQATLNAGSGAPGVQDRRLENAGYRMRVLDNRAYLISEPIGENFGIWLDDDEFPYPCDLCGSVTKREQFLNRAPLLRYDAEEHHHLLFCESCQDKAPIFFALCDRVAGDQFQRLRVYLANLVECLDFSEPKKNRLSEALKLNDPARGQVADLPVSLQDLQHRQHTKDALAWRAFLMANYLVYVADIFVYCPRSGTPEQRVNPWTTLRNGDGHPEAVRFAQSLATREFEAAVFCHEIVAAMADYPDCLAFRWKSYPMSRLLIPSSDEGLQDIGGFLDVRHNARAVDWYRFLSNTTAESMPWWGFDAFETIVKLATKAAKLALSETGLGGASQASGRLEGIENQTHAIYEMQLPMAELQEETKRAVDKQADLLQQISRQLSRPDIRQAEASLQKLLGESVFGALVPEAKAAALEGELKYLQREYADPSIIPFQLAKAFECQVRSVIKPFLQRRRSQVEYQPTLDHIQRWLEASEREFLEFLRDNGLDHRLLQQKIEKVRQVRNDAAHNAAMTEQRARELRDAWLGVRNGDNMFKAVVAKRAANARGGAETEGAKGS